MKKQNVLYSLILPVIFTTSISTASAVELDTILITASRTPTTINATGSAITVITAEEISNSQQPYLADVIRGVPGVAVSQSGSLGGTTEIRMRGTESNHVLVFIDGIEMNSGDGSRVDFGNILSADIERVEILRGSQSALWGSDAVGGVIAITTKRGKEGKHNSSFRLETGSYNTKNYSLGVTGGSKTTRYAINFSHVDTDGYSSADDDPFVYTLPNGTQVTQGGTGVEDDEYKNTTLGITASHDINDNLDIETAIRHIRSTVYFDDFAGAIGVFDSSTPYTISEQDYIQTTIRHKMLEGRLQNQFKIANSDIDRLSNGAFGTSVSRSRKTQYIYQLDYFFPQADTDKASHNITFSTEREIDSNFSTFSGFNENASDSFIVEYKFSYDEDFSSALTYRRDNNKIFQNTDIGHASLSYQLSPQYRIHSSYGTGIKNPTLTELFGYSATFPGNTALNPEKSKSLDIGLDWRINKQHSIDITLFDLRIDDQIVGNGNTSSNVKGESKTTGVEVSYKGTIGKDWLVNSNITLQDAEDANGNNLIRRAKSIANLSVTHKSLNDKLSNTLIVNYNGKQNSYYFDAGYNTEIIEVDSYVVANFSTRYRLNKTTSLSARIDNVFDETYQEVNGYGTSDRAYYLGVQFDI